MLARVQRLERARSPRSPIAAAFGSFEAFAADCEAGMDAGRLDKRDFPAVLLSLARWDKLGAAR